MYCISEWLDNLTAHRSAINDIAMTEKFAYLVYY
jgi:hypothetical protein